LIEYGKNNLSIVFKREALKEDKEMEIMEIRAFEGRNIYCHRPVIRMTVEVGEYDEIPTKDIRGFNDGLLKFLPGLCEHGCCFSEKGGFCRRLEKGTYIPHVIEHAALEIQTMLGFDVRFGKTRGSGKPGQYHIIFGYVSKTGGLESAKLAWQIVKELLDGNDSFDIKNEIDRIRKIVGDYEFGPSTDAIIKAAQARGIPYIRLNDKSLVQLNYGKYQKRVQATITGGTGCIGVDIACDKTVTKDLLSMNGIPVPCGGIAYSEKEAVELARKIGFPVVVKPCDGNQGKGVTLNLKNASEVRTAFRVALGYSNQIIVEKHIKGRHYRVLVVDGKVVAAAERIPAHVVGDGIHNIAELVEITNSDPLRGEKHEKPLTKIKIDPVVTMVLARQKMTVDYVPKYGETVALRENGNLSTGGIAVDVTDEIHPANRLLAERSARLVGLDVAGIDLTTDDISMPAVETGGAVIEVNAAPGIRMHLYPSRGKARNVAKDIVDMMFGKGVVKKIPIISITGTNGKTTTTRLTGFIMGLNNMTVGMTTTDGIYLGGRRVVKGDTTGPWSARAVLCDPLVEAAVLETARGGLLRGGLAYDLSDVGVITNISEDHLGLDGINTVEEMLHVKSLVIEAVKDEGYSILNADDPLVIQMMERAKGKLLLFSYSDDNLIVRKHVSEGGSAVVVLNGFVTFLHSDKQQRIIKIKDIPITLSGRARHNVQNALAATAAAWAAGVPLEIIKQGLKQFKNDTEHNPGRTNMLEVAGITVVVDYGHNQAGLETTIASLKKLCNGSFIGVITSPGDRRDDAIYKMGFIAGKGFSRIILKEDANLRGREPGQVANLLLSGALDAGMKKENTQVILSESEAIEAAVKQSCPGDMVVIFYEDYDLVMNTLDNIKSKISLPDSQQARSLTGETAG
jgi:cyanophycin synthetase